MGRIAEGLALVAGAIAVSVFSAGIGAALFGTLLATSAAQVATVIAIASSVGSLGVSLVTSGIARALGDGPSLPFSLREPAANRQTAYGQCRIAGTITYVSTSQSGSHLNQVVLWAGHQISSIDTIYVDGRAVIGTFPGYDDGNNHTDDAGNTYNLQGTTYLEHSLGTPSGHWFESLYSVDPAWDSSCTLNGIAATYVRLNYSASVYPAEPGIKANVHGKANIYDPRLGSYGAAGTTGYTNNAALCLLDVLLDNNFGLGCTIAEIDIDNFILAANICDEQVELAAGGTESRFCCNGFFDAGATPPGEIISAMLLNMAGKLTYTGGVYAIYPGAFNGSGQFYDESSFVGPVKWTSRRKYRDTVNAVRCSYVSPKYPYNVVGYDQDHRDTAIFGGEWQVANAPEYAQDALHGYPSDANLATDGGVKLYMDMSLRFCTSISQAQRIMKINLLRNRFSGSGTWQMNLSAMLSAPQDVIQIIFAPLNMVTQYHEITAMRFNVIDDDASADDEGDKAGVKAKKIVVEVDTISTDPSVYLWSPGEELTFQDSASPVVGQTWTCNPPTDMVCESGSDSAVVGLDGITIPRINVQWIESDDPFVLSGGTYELQLQKHGATTWTSVGVFGATVTQFFVTGVVCSQTYNLQLRAIRSNGMSSVWVQVLGHTVSITLSSITSESISGLGVLAGLNYVDFSTTQVVNKGAGNMTYSNGLTVQELMPATTLADQTAGQSIDVLADGTTYSKVLGNNLLSGFVTGASNGANLLGNPGFEANLSNVPNDNIPALGKPLTDNWFCGQTSTGGIEMLYEVGAGQSRSGGADCLIQTIPGATVQGGANGVRAFSTRMSCLGGAFISYGGYVNTVCNTPVPSGGSVLARVGLYFYSATGGYLAEDYTQQVYNAGANAANGGYTLMAGLCVVPMSAAQMSFECCVFSTGSAFTPPAGTTVIASRFDDCYVNQTYSSSSLLIPQGSIQPSSVPNITFSSTTSSITLSWPTTTITRADGNTSGFSGGSQTFSGLSSSTSYRLYMFGNIATSTFQFASSTLQTTPSPSEALAASSDGRIPIEPFSVSTTSSGTSSGTAGGAALCPDESEMVDVEGKGSIPAGSVEIKDMILGRCFETDLNVYRKVTNISTHSASSWRMINHHRVSPCEPVYFNGRWIPAFQVPGATLDMTIGRKVMITVQSDSYNQSNYYLVSGDELLVHNSGVLPS